MGIVEDAQKSINSASKVNKFHSGFPLSSNNLLCNSKNVFSNNSTLKNDENNAFINKSFFNKNFFNNDHKNILSEKQNNDNFQSFENAEKYEIANFIEKDNKDIINETLDFLERKRNRKKSDISK